MFYEPRKGDHGLPHDPYNAIVGPRPIGWITSMSAKGEINLAPYSYFNGVSSRPAMIMFSSEGRKDSIAFVEETREALTSADAHVVAALRTHVEVALELGAIQHGIASRALDPQALRHRARAALGLDARGHDFFEPGHSLRDP